MSTLKTIRTTLLCSLLASGAAGAQTTQSWMSPDVGAAWSLGYKGQGTTITVVDDFKSSQAYWGKLASGLQLKRHGEWTASEAAMEAPGATVRAMDFSLQAPVPLSKGLNVLNLSYGMYAPSGYSPTTIRWGTREQSIITDAKNGLAVVSKAAGNDGVAVGARNASGNVDYLNTALKGGKSAIYVGALDKNGTTASKATIASYSNRAGTDAAVQRQFVVVGVEGNKTNLYGTSFAAPVVSAYAAILGSKFTSATPTQITNQLLNTARQDTVANYNVAVHGRGEASLSRALAPKSVQ